jgi:hypothetical protein
VTEQDQLELTPEWLEASDGDVAEQRRKAVPDADEDDELAAPRVPFEADPADAFEQQQPVPDPDDYA